MEKEDSRFASLDEAKEKKIDELLQCIYRKYPTTPPQLASFLQITKDSDSPTPCNPVRLYGYSFLVSRKWNVSNAMTMVDKVIQYREECCADERAIFPAPFSVRGWSIDEVEDFLGRGRRERGVLDQLAESIDSVLEAGVHYWDRYGNPVFYVMAGRVNESGLMKLLKRQGKVGAAPSKTLWPFVENYLLTLENLCRYQNAQKENGTLTDGISFSKGVVRDISVVMDCRDLHYKMLWKPFIDLVKETMTTLFSVFPNCVFQIYLVNAPAVTRIAYAMVKPLLDDNIQSKVHIYSSNDTYSALEKLIDPKFIPSFLGGSCTCPGNCISTLDPTTLDKGRNRSASGNDEHEEGLTETIKVAAGARIQKEISAELGDVIVWNFAGSEVEFFSYFLPIPVDEVRKKGILDKRKYNDFIFFHGKVKSQCNSYTAAESGTIVLIFDNSKAWLNSASLDLQIERSTATAPDLLSNTDLTSRNSCSRKEDDAREVSSELTETREDL